MGQDRYERSIEEYKDFPYCVIGHTHLPQSFSVFLQGDSLKKITKQMRDGEDLRITFYSEKKATEFEIVDTDKKYPPQKKE